MDSLLSKILKIAAIVLGSAVGIIILAYLYLFITR